MDVSKVLSKIRLLLWQTSDLELKGFCDIGKSLSPRISWELPVSKGSLSDTPFH